MNQSCRRLITAIVVVFLLGIGTTAMSFRARQYGIRLHAQRTLNDLKQVQIGSSDLCHVFSEWHKQWRTHLTSKGSCDDPNHFYMDVNIQNPPYLWPTCFEDKVSAMHALVVRGGCGLYKALVGNSIIFMARIEGVGGVVTRKSAQVYAVVPNETPGDYTLGLLSATATTATHFRKTASGTTQQQSLHPTYQVLVGTSRVNADYMPGAQVYYIDAEVAADADKADSERLFLFDLSCVTRGHPCSRHDLMPAAYDQFETDVRQLMARPQQQ
jgi:hypothetical protein